MSAFRFLRFLSASWFKSFIFHPVTYFLIMFLVSFLTLHLSVHAQSTPVDDCINNAIPDLWKAHFPFDLIYPIGEMKDAASECPKINFWDKEREVCSIKTLIAIIKNVFLAKLVIQSLFTL